MKHLGSVAASASAAEDVMLVRLARPLMSTVLGYGMGIADGSGRFRGEAQSTCGRQSGPVTPERKNPLLAGPQQVEPQGSKNQKHLGPADQVGCPSCYFGAQSQVQIQRIY